MVIVPMSCHNELDSFGHINAEILEIFQGGRTACIWCKARINKNPLTVPYVKEYGFSVARTKKRYL
jgi:hypothetical protein